VLVSIINDDELMPPRHRLSRLSRADPSLRPTPQAAVAEVLREAQELGVSEAAAALSSTISERIYVNLRGAAVTLTTR